MFPSSFAIKERGHPTALGPTDVHHGIPQTKGYSSCWRDVHSSGQKLFQPQLNCPTHNYKSITFAFTRPYAFVIQGVLSLLVWFDQEEIDTVIINSWRKSAGTQLYPAIQSCSGVWILCTCLSRAPTIPIIPASTSRLLPGQSSHQGKSISGLVLK